MEAVASLVGRADCLCGLLYIISIHLYSTAVQWKIKGEKTRHLYTLLAYMCSILACFAKEIGATIFGLFCVIEMCGTLTDASFKLTQLKRRKCR